MPVCASQLLLLLVLLATVQYLSSRHTFPEVPAGYKTGGRILHIHTHCFYSNLANTSAVPRQRLSDHKTRFRSEMPTFLLQAHTHLPKLSDLMAQSPSVLAHSHYAFLCCRLQHCIQVLPHVSECPLSFLLGYYPNPASADLFLPRMLLSGYLRQMYLRQIHQHPSARPALPWHSLNTLPVSLYSGLVFLIFR